SEFEVIATVGDGHALVRTVQTMRPDVVVTDIVMPGLDGIAATVALLRKRPDTRVVLATVHDDPELAERGYAAGALGFVSKHHAGKEWIRGAGAALGGERYFSSPPRRHGGCPRNF